MRNAPGHSLPSPFGRGAGGKGGVERFYGRPRWDGRQTVISQYHTYQLDSQLETPRGFGLGAFFRVVVDSTGSVSGSP